MDRVHDQVEQNLIELIAYRKELGRIVRALHHEHHLSAVGLALKEQRPLAHKLAEVARLARRIVSLATREVHHGRHECADAIHLAAR